MNTCTLCGTVCIERGEFVLCRDCIDKNSNLLNSLGMSDYTCFGINVPSRDGSYSWGDITNFFKLQSVRDKFEC